MKVIIVYAGTEQRPQDLPGQRSLALRRLAGSNVIGHVLNQLGEIKVRQLTILVEADGGEIAGWLEDRLPEIDVTVVTAAPDSSILLALADYVQHMNDESLLLIRGNYVVEADYVELERSTADAICFTAAKQQTSTDIPPAEEDETTELTVCACYFRRGSDLKKVLEKADQVQATTFTSLLDSLKIDGFQIEEWQTTLCLDTRAAGDLIEANARLLGLGYGSEDAIERSYVEDFTVIPPVFIHESAYVENAVVGPFTNVEAGAEIRNSVVRNTLIGVQATVENAVLDGSVIGDRAHVSATGHAILAENETNVMLD